MGLICGVGLQLANSQRLSFLLAKDSWKRDSESERICSHGRSLPQFILYFFRTVAAQLSHVLSTVRSWLAPVSALHAAVGLRQKGARLNGPPTLVEGVRTDGCYDASAQRLLGFRPEWRKDITHLRQLVGKTLGMYPILARHSTYIVAQRRNDVNVKKNRYKSRVHREFL